MSSELAYRDNEFAVVLCKSEKVEIYIWQRQQMRAFDSMRRPTKKLASFVAVKARNRVRVRDRVSQPLFRNKCPSVCLSQVETLHSTPPTHTCKAQG